MIFNAEISYLLLLRNYDGQSMVKFYLFILEAGFKRKVPIHFLGKIANVRKFGNLMVIMENQCLLYDHLWGSILLIFVLINFLY